MNIGILSNILRENSINNNKTVGNSLEKLSTGLRINKAADNASGLAISDKLRTQATGIKQGIDNANSAIAMMNIADKSMDELSNILDTIKAKAIQMNTDTTSQDGRKTIKTDILKLIDSYDDIVCRTNYNQTPLLNGCSSPFTFQVGDNTSDIISIDIDSVESRHMGEPDPYKLKNLNTGFNMPVVAPPQTNIIGGEDSSTYIITEGPSSERLTVADKSAVKISFFSSSQNIEKMDIEEVSNYYQDEGFTTNWLGSLGTTTRLNDYNIDSNLLIVFQPTQEFNQAEIDTMMDFLDKGGRIFFVGEHSGYAQNENQNISDAISKLNGNIKVLVGSYSDDNNQTNIDENMNLNNSKLLSGVTSFQTDHYAQLQVDGRISQAVMVDDNGRIIMADQSLSKGRVTVIADQNWFKDIDNKFAGNKIFLDNLAINSYNNYEEVLLGNNPNESFGNISSTATNPTNPSCGCDYTDLTRNDDSPTLVIQARNLMKVIDEALSQLNSQRSNVGAGTNQLESSARNHLTSYVNLKNAESIIRDVDYAQESANFNKANIISQAGSYVQSQANEIDKQYVAQLLK